MDWTQIMLTLIAALIPTGGVLGIFTIRERKTEMMLDNANKINSQWADIVAKEEERRKELKADLDSKDAKIDRLYADISVLRDKNDKLGSKVAYLNAYRCRKVGCIERIPPFGSTTESKEAQ